MSMYGVPQGVSHPVGRVAGQGPDGEAGHGKTPGTLVLVLVFLATFAVYYFVNWKLLSFVWKIG